MKPSYTVKGFGQAKNLFHQLKLNPLLIDHPLIRVTAVHEAQHLADYGPLTPSVISIVRDSLDIKYVERTESRAFGREYDYMQELLKTPGFDAEVALAEFNREPIPQAELEKTYYPKYKLDDPVLNEWGEPSSQFRVNPEKFYKDEGARAVLSHFFIRQANGMFISRIKAVQIKTKEEYIKDRIEDYDEQISRQKRIAYTAWALSGSAVAYCSFLAYVLGVATVN